MGSDFLKKPVVCGLVPDDITAKVKDRAIKQFRQYQVKHVDDSACPSIAIIKWMDAFKLVMDDRQLYQWVNVIGILVDVFFEIA